MVVDTVSPQPFVILMTRLGEIATLSVGVVSSPGGVTSFLLISRLSASQTVHVASMWG